MGSCLGMSVALAVVAGTAAAYEQTGSVSSSSASIAFIFIFGVVFAVAFTPMQPIYPAEVLASKSSIHCSSPLATRHSFNFLDDMRANGMMVFQITAGCASFVNTFAAPIAMENIRYWL
jgi:hypothetical protein